MLEVEAAYVTSSAACGLVLTAAACMAGTDPDKITQLPDTAGMRHEIIIQKIHRIAYDQAIRLAGATLIEIDDQGTPPTEEMRRAINENTAAIFFMATVMDHPSLCTNGRGCIYGKGGVCAGDCGCRVRMSAGFDLDPFLGGRSRSDHLQWR